MECMLVFKFDMILTIKLRGYKIVSLKSGVLCCFHKVISVEFFFFFFQAEDGIRDIGVTGVQTCALPILRASISPRVRSAVLTVSVPGLAVSPPWAPVMISVSAAGTIPARSMPSTKISLRSEERRVGEEGRSRWSPYY